MALPASHQPSEGLSGLPKVSDKGLSKRPPQPDDGPWPGSRLFIIRSPAFNSPKQTVCIRIRSIEKPANLR